VEALGFNFRLTDIQAALGTSQMRRLKEFVDRRNALADRYRRLLADLPLPLPPAAPPGYRHAYHLFPIRVDERDRVYRELRDAGVGVQVHYVPVHHHPPFAHLAASGGFPNADRAYARLLSLPLFPDLREDEQDHVIQALRSAL
jgi:dTDP-4-amino-4,6-dideoxygalactose transaminase